MLKKNNIFKEVEYIVILFEGVANHKTVSINMILVKNNITAIINALYSLNYLCLIVQ